MLSKERIEALCTDGMYAGVNGDQAEWNELRDLALRALHPEEGRSLNQLAKELAEIASWIPESPAHRRLLNLSLGLTKAHYTLPGDAQQPQVERCPYFNDDGHVAHRCPHCSLDRRIE